MDGNILSIVSIISYAVSSLFLLITIILFFKLKIPNIIGELSGRTERRAIEGIRNQSVNDSQKKYASRYLKSANLSRISYSNRLNSSDKLSPSSKIRRPASMKLENQYTAKLDMPKDDIDVQQGQEYGETVVLTEFNKEDVVFLDDIVICGADEEIG